MFKVLFICSGNKNSKPGAVVTNQAESLKKRDVTIHFFLIKGKGVKGYLKNLSALKKEIKSNDYDLIHAHGFASLLTGVLFNKPIVASILGSEVLENPKLKIAFKLLSRFKWKHTIVKTEELENVIRTSAKQKISVIPNGVDLNLYKPLDKASCRNSCDIPKDKRIVLFLADITRRSKNFELAKTAFDKVSFENAKLKALSDIPVEQVSKYINAADVVLLTSRWEGSPNIVKEAMACNKPIVATKVGDVEWLLGNEPGHFITGFDPSDVAKKIQTALEYAEKAGTTNGRKRILELGLDSDSIAKRIISIYKDITQIE